MLHFTPRPCRLPSQALGQVPVFHQSVSWSLASSPQFVSVAPVDHQTRLCDSVRPASPQVQGHLVHFGQGRRCPCLACGDCSPAGEGCDRAVPSSWYEVGVLQPLLHCAQEKQWVTTDLASASFESCCSVQMPFKMLTQKLIFKSCGNKVVESCGSPCSPERTGCADPQLPR